MTVGIVGLGLIGGSFAKAYSAGGEFKVLAYDINENAMSEAFDKKIIDDTLNTETIPTCDLILLALYPKASIDYLTKMSPLFSKNTVVIDCCGTKRQICDVGFSLADKYGFTFIGGHPMAGRHFSGFGYSTKNMYNGASMVLVPKNPADEDSITLAKKLLSPVKFGTFTISTAEKHDSMIAFTSQLAHIVSNAYVKSPTAKEHDGFSAGSYKDLTRVAWLNETMWSELFMENKDMLINELDNLIASLFEYKTALEEDNIDTLKDLLADGKKCKEAIDGLIG